ncbi:MAG: type I-U CRISPR-associated protein Cas5/Cas6 [Phycisphaeraceae bacterium]|nr:type I-U CRISPR-associated protein Cas5/Cas6 [Phycisphaeraceae bacterium]
MIAISLSFPAGRYHATPWGRHVNEGAVEWPPSPWRLLRSLVAVWKRTLPDISESQIKPIFEVLAATPPRFVLPPASTGHTRHYMPWYKKGPDDRTLVFDAFVALDPHESAVVAAWPDATLSEAQRELLSRLLANLNFLGRAESWCEARLLTDDEAIAALEDGDRYHTSPIDPHAEQASRCGLELVRTLCPDPETVFGDEHVTDRRMETVEVAVQSKKGIKVNKENREVPVPIYDPNWHLCMETLRLHEQKWSDPPGSRWITYARPRTCFEVRPAPRRPRRGQSASDPIPRCFRFALDASVLPLVTETLPLAEAARRALMSLYGRQNERAGIRGRSATFSGKDANGTPLSGHRHAYFLPTDEDGDGRLDHLTIYAAGGFGAGEVRAMERLRKINHSSSQESSPNLRVLLLGQPSTLGPNDASLPLASSHCWISVTPYLITRHAKARGPHRVDLRDRAACEDFFRRDIMAQLRSARPDLGEALDAVRIESLCDDQGRFVLPIGRDASRSLRPIQFRRFRRKAGDDGGRRPGGSFRILFPEPVAGPIALGHSAHFGMGLFMPVC